MVRGIIAGMGSFLGNGLFFPINGHIIPLSLKLFALSLLRPYHCSKHYQASL
jgi:hypothetical protein